ncbi:MAG: PQQ-dependent sugar dehydrogenase [Pyrinomonadaceae bacterium]
MNISGSICALLAAIFSSCAMTSPVLLDTNQVFSDSNGAVRFRVETIANDLEVPWGFAWLPTGEMLVTERPGRVRMIVGKTLKKEPVFVVPDVEPSGESGLMDISIHPNFAKNNFVYLAYSYNADGKRVKVVRYVYSDGKFTDPKIIIDNVPGAPNHAGMRARFGPDLKLYITTGDSTEMKLAQDNNSLAGKTLRLNDDGTVPKDNPFVGKAGYRPEIWSTGHRNAQGITWQRGSGLMFQSEHGPSGFEGKGGGGDEVNIVERGKNYGWPTISHREQKPGLVSPLLEYSPACAPASATFYNGDVFPDLKGNLLIGCLRGVRIIRVALGGREVLGQENLLEGKVGRIREVAEGPDGLIYFSTSNRDGRGKPAIGDDRIMRLVPAE